MTNQLEEMAKSVFPYLVGGTFLGGIGAGGLMIYGMAIQNDELMFQGAYGLAFIVGPLGIITGSLPCLYKKEIDKLKEEKNDKSIKKT